MKYEIKTEGGFAGICKKDVGHLELSPNEKEALIKMVEFPSLKTTHKDLRDGFRYIVTLIDGEKKYHCSYNDMDLPLVLRKLVHETK